MKLGRNSVMIRKKAGETPLEALERFRRSKVKARPELATASMTYAGRLDPMAEGKLLILIGDECKKKEKYLGLDKEYEVEYVWGIQTDTMDALGMPKIAKQTGIRIVPLAQYVGKFRQKYPAYSSKTVKGRQLHELARKGQLPDEMPEKTVEIHSIIGARNRRMTAKALLKDIESRITKVKGDFRQEKIVKAWRKLLKRRPRATLYLNKIKVRCSSGTYMRSLADRIGRDGGSGAFALSIKRTKIFIK